MKSNIENFKKIGIRILLATTLLILLILSICKKDFNFSIVKNSLGYSIIITSVIVTLIDKYFWKKILLYFKDKEIIWKLIETYETPILNEEYNCLIKYKWNGNPGVKNAKVKIEQTYTSTYVTVITDEIESNTIISEIVKENNKFVLYYIYRTNPKAEFNPKNRPQLGGCQIILDSISEKNANKELTGSYWTTSNTTGDMEFYL